MTTASLAGAMQPYALTLDRFMEHAARWHGATEVVTAGSGGVRTRAGYTALRDRSKRLSGALLSLGLAPGDHLGVLAWNSQAHMECWYGAMGVGIVCHTLNPRLSAANLAAMIQQAANRVLVVSCDLSLLVEKLIPLCPTIENVVVLGEPGTEVSLPSCGDVLTWRYDNLLDARGVAAVWGGFDENTPAGLCFTSGTTGAPKGVTYTHRSNYLHTIHQLQADMSGLTARDTMLIAVPMFHANGWGLPFAGPAVGAKLVLPGRYQDGASLAGLINGEGVTVAAGVATVWLALQRGHEGRLWARGASTVERYFGHDDPAVNADGWFDTGDLAVIDESGNLSITGRAKDLIKSGGEWINPAEIEAIVGALPEVALVAVVGRSHPKWGERPILVVEPRKGAHIADEALLDALRPRVANWWLPDAIVRVPAMPLAMTGKIDKVRLRAEHG
jgi:acyl-CoA synthetase (AMP-forming)/AMP-acid ligase II